MPRNLSVENMNLTKWANLSTLATKTSLSAVDVHFLINHKDVNGSQENDHGNLLILEPDNIISNEVASGIIRLLAAGLIPLLFVVGVPGNILCAAVFYKLGLRERINVCVFALALTDLATIFFTFSLSFEWDFRDLAGIEFNFCIQYFIGPLGFMFASMFVSTTIACERCFCVVNPFKAQKYVKTSTSAVVIIVVSLILVGGMYAIAGHMHEAVWVFDPVTNTTKSVVYLTSYYLNNKEIIDIFDIFVYSMLFPLAALFVIVITTVITAIKLRDAVAWRGQSSKNPATTSNNDSAKVKTSSKEVALTKMLIGTSVLFVICMTPVVTVQMVMYFVKELNYDGRYANVTSVLWNIIALLRMVNWSLNFFVYYKIGTRFRKTVKEMMSCCCSCSSGK